MAEYFRDEMGQDVLLFVDNIFRFSQAGSEVSALLGRSPSAVGYQPTLAEEMGNLQERITSTKKGSITSFQAVYVPADDLTDPAPANTFAHLDSTIVLERSIAELGIYPAVDPLASVSNALSPEIVGEEHFKVARGVQEVLQAYKDLQDIIAILGLDELSPEQKQCLELVKIQKFLSQPFHVAEVFTGVAGEYVSVKDTIRGFKMILDGELDEVAEKNDFYMKEALTLLSVGRTLDLKARISLMSLTLEIVTPESKVYSEEIDHVVVPTSNGKINILPNHVPIIDKLVAGDLKVEINGNQEYLAVSSGFVGVFEQSLYSYRRSLSY